MALFRTNDNVQNKEEFEENNQLTNNKISRGPMTTDDVSIISNNVKIEGKLISSGNVRIDGTIDGDVIVHGNLTLGETAFINGEVKAENITVGGKVTGYVYANEKLILESKSGLEGDITAKTLVIEAGAKFNGKSYMVDPNQQKAFAQAAEEKKDEDSQIPAFTTQGFRIASNLDDEQ